MNAKIIAGFCLLLWVVDVYGLSLAPIGMMGDSNSNEDTTPKEKLEALKEFIAFVDQYNLNVTIIGSQRKYGSGGWVKEDMSVTIQMPTNEENLKQATLDDAKQDKFLKKMQKWAKKEKIGAKTRVISIENGSDHEKDVQTVNPTHIIDSPSYILATHFKNGERGFQIDHNETNEILYNYVITEPSDEVKRVQVVTANVVINELDKSSDFPPEVLEEMKHILPKLYLAIDDETLLARLLTQHLDNKFKGNHQALIGVEHFALGGKKFANLKVANTNVIVFYI